MFSVNTDVARGKGWLTCHSKRLGASADNLSEIPGSGDIAVCGE